MNDQLCLFPPDFSESGIYEMLEPYLYEVLEKNGIRDEHLEFIEHNNPKSKYSSVMIKSYLSFRIYKLKKRAYFEFHEKLKRLLPDDVAANSKTKAEGNLMFVRVYFDSMEQVATYIPWIVRIFDATIDLIPKEFDCCALYEQCSDNLGCVCNDQDLAMTCGYKRILKSGRVFYGKNRNV